MTGMSPLLKARDAVPGGSGHIFHLDFSQVYEVDALGTGISIACLAQIGQKITEGKFQIRYPDHEASRMHLNQLGLNQHLSRLGMWSEGMSDLLSILAEPVSSVQDLHTFERIVTILPLGTGDRNQVLSGIKLGLKEFLSCDAQRSFAHEQVLILLMEMVKNTIDHSNQIAVLGLRMTIVSGGSSRLSFAYCDTGDGIGKTVRRSLENAPEFPHFRLLKQSDTPRRGLAAKGGFSDLLRWALAAGNSTKHGNGVNFGLGLTMISEGARNCNMRLTLKDANSIWILSNIVGAPPSHKAVRNSSVITCSGPLMMFHGLMDF